MGSGIASVVQFSETLLVLRQALNNLGTTGVEEITGQNASHDAPKFIDYWELDRALEHCCRDRRMRPTGLIDDGESTRAGELRATLCV